MNEAQRRRIAILSLTGPAYLWLALTFFLPLSALFFFSFLEVAPLGGRPIVFTLDQYRAYVDKWSGFYGPLTFRSLELGLEVTLGCLIVGYPAAFALAKFVPGRWREALFLLVVLPFWSNALVRTFSWAMVLRTDGLLDRAVHLVMPGAPSLGILFTWPAIVIGLVHSFVPYMILTCYIALQGIDDSLIEAARSLGGSSASVFRRVVLPLSLPGILAGVVLVFVPVIGSFMEPRILGGRAGIMLGTRIEDQFTAVFNWPLGAALSFILLAIVLLIFGATFPFLRRHMDLA